MIVEHILLILELEHYFINIRIFRMGEGAGEVDLNQTLSAHSLQLCPILCNPMVCSPTGSSVHGILQARTLE